MIWTDYSADTIFSGSDVTIDSDNYIFARYENVPTRNYPMDYLGFMKNPPDGPGTVSRTISIMAFFDYLLFWGYVTPVEYTGSISLGNEVWFGSGEVLIRNYEVEVC
jgi:hypothetical protein